MIALFIHTLVTSPVQLLESVREVLADADRMASKARRYGLH